MRGLFGFTLALGLLALGAGGCSSDDGDGGAAASCSPGDAVACACINGAQGTQACLADGTLGACDCGEGTMPAGTNTATPIPGATEPGGTDPGGTGPGGTDPGGTAPVEPPPVVELPPVVEPPPPPPPNPTDPFDAARQACVDKINALRATMGLPPYERWLEGEACADQESQLDGDANDAHGSFGQCNEYAQNTCLWRNSTNIERCLDGMWAEGEPPVARDQCRNQCYLDHGHYIAMSSTRYTKVACGFYESGGRYWALQNFQ